MLPNCLPIISMGRKSVQTSMASNAMRTGRKRTGFSANASVSKPKHTQSFGGRLLPSLKTSFGPRLGSHVDSRQLILVWDVAGILLSTAETSSKRDASKGYESLLSKHLEDDDMHFKAQATNTLWAKICKQESIQK